MRISDWSSDVCSSDLVETKVAAGHEYPLNQKLFFVSRKDAKTRRGWGRITPPRADCAKRLHYDAACGDGARSRPSAASSFLCVFQRNNSAAVRSEERRVGKECDSTCSSR